MASSIEAFVDAALPRIRAAQTDLYAGDATSWPDYWSSAEPVSWLGHFGTCATGAASVRVHSTRVASRFTDLDRLDIEVLVADLFGEIGYLVTRERLSMRLDGDRFDQTARVSRVLRRESGEWRIAHGHADLDPLTLDLPFKPPTQPAGDAP